MKCAAQRVIGQTSSKETAMTDPPNDTTVKQQVRAALLDDVGDEESRIADAEYDRPDSESEDTSFSRND